MHKFCHHCGKQVMVGAKFCAFCGTSLATLSATPTPAPPPASSPGQFAPFAARPDDEEGDDYIDKLQHAIISQNELHVEIIRDRPLGETIGSVMANPMKAEPIDSSVRPAPPSSEEFKAAFQREAGTLRNENTPKT
jgi:hypothetical protein